jgi:hypothetical protein
MGNWLRRRLTFANVVSVVALFIALGGGAYALSSGSVGARNLQRKSVGFGKLKPAVHAEIRKGVMAATVADMGEPLGNNNDPCQYAGNANCQNVAGEEHTPAPFVGGSYTVNCPSGMVVAETTDNLGDLDPVWTLITNAGNYSATGQFGGSRVDDGEYTALTYGFDYYAFDRDHVQGFAACVPQ